MMNNTSLIDQLNYKLFYLCLFCKAASYDVCLAARNGPRATTFSAKP
jgi:hypothetical protein